MRDKGSQSIEIVGLTKTYGTRSERVTAVDSLDLVVPPGEAMALLGPSGCGKTTTLRCVAGLERPDRGVISVGDHVVVRVGGDSRDHFDAPERRDIGMVFQSYALWPHMTVFDNVAYPLKARSGTSPVKRELDKQVMDALERVACHQFSKRYPGQLSGGQQQRIALARALVRGSSVILFDEPLSNLDARLREDMRFELAQLQRDIGFSALYVTHDQEEAMAFASRMAVMHEGRIEQVGTPEEVYQRPTSPIVARFIGKPHMVSGDVAFHDAVAGTTAVDCAFGRLSGKFIGGGRDDGPCEVYVRPEQIAILDHGGDTAPVDGHGTVIDAVVRLKTFLGAKVVLSTWVNDHELRPEVNLSRGTFARQLADGDRVSVHIPTEAVLIYPTPLDRSTAPPTATEDAEPGASAEGRAK